MKSILLNLDSSSDKNLYEQVYEALKNDIVSGKLGKGTKLPSLRKLSADNGISITTIDTAYSQLLVEGYIESRPKSGYYVRESIEEISGGSPDSESEGIEAYLGEETSRSARMASSDGKVVYDEKSFDFTRWKRCMNKVFNDHSRLLRTPADVKGEPALRYELAKHLYQSRGVKCTPEQIIIGAGTQQLMIQLTRILKAIGVENALTEKPGYGPVRNIFKDEGFPLTEIPVNQSGIILEKLPSNIRSVVYVCPSNQFPSGAVMPAARRYELIKWAKANDSYVLEDDYDSELRYFGKPIPAMQGMDSDGRVIYLGAFSSTLFASIKISYMVLPEELMKVFEERKSLYAQTCSKAEQLCLSLYMEDGSYYAHIRKLRRLYSSKLDITMELFRKHGEGIIEAVNSQSGLAVMLKIRSQLPAAELCRIAEQLGLTMKAVDDLCTDEEKVVYFYFYMVPESLLKIIVKMFIQKVAPRKR